MVTLFALAMLNPASAQTAADWTINPTVLLTGADVSFGSTIGSPTVVYDSVNDRYFMFFESFIGSTANCPAGEWGIGRAISTDGISWTVAAAPLIDPDPAAGTPNYYSCVAAHPGAIYLPAAAGAPGGTIYVYFKAEQADDACTVLPSAPSWGCDQYTGIGAVRIRLKAAGGVKDQTFAPAPVLAKNTNFGYPKPMRYNSTAVLAYTEYPDVYIATASSPLGPFIDQGVALEQSVLGGTVPWVDDEFYNAALSCRDVGVAPLEFFAGSRDNDFGIAITGAVGKAVASPSNFTSWLVDTDAQFAFSGSDDFRHWDVLRYDASDYLFYYDEKDGSGNNQIRMATTLPSFSWTNSLVYDKACP